MNEIARINEEHTECQASEFWDHQHLFTFKECMGEQEPENNVEKNHSKAVKYPEKSRIQGRKVFWGRYTQQRKIP